MFKLKKIQNIEYQRTCFCGQPLVGFMCEIHGTDVKISTKMIQAQFEFISPDANSKNLLAESAVSIRLPENQFKRLFRRTLSEELEQRLNYRIRVHSFGAELTVEEIVSSFFEQIEFDHFFGKKRIRETQITNSGVTIHFLLSHNFISNNEVEVSFEVVILRSISDYISWRIDHFKAKTEALTASLTTQRASVWSETSEPFKITAVEWNDKGKQAKTIGVVPITDKVENPTKRKMRSGKLYQDQAHFHLSSRVERRIASALRNFASSFLKSLEQFLVRHSCKMETTKRSKEQVNDKEYTKLLGTKITPTRFFWQKISEKIDSELLRKIAVVSLPTAYSKAASQERFLLVLSGSDEKNPKKEDIPAIIRYRRAEFYVLKQLLLLDRFPATVDLLLFSAKSGIISPDRLISYYQQEPNIEEKQYKKLLTKQLQDFQVSKYKEICFITKENEGKLLEEILQQENGSKVTSVFIEGSASRKALKMVNWLAEKR